jgi:uncharacterized protein YndB with AHSA1/START domain
MTDISTSRSGTDREIGRRTIAAGEARTALVRRRYDAPIEDVWSACTDPDRVRRWLLPVTGDLRVGGRFALEGNASGEILRCEPPRLLAVTWVYGDRPADEVELRLSRGDDGGTLLELEHATVAELAPGEVDGAAVDAVLGVGLGWELPLTYALPAFLAGSLPAAPPDEEAMTKAVTSAARAWAAVLEAASGGHVT